MSLPQPYSRTYSFTGFQSANPSSPLPGPKLDIELDEISNNLGGLAASVPQVISDAITQALQVYAQSLAAVLAAVPQTAASEAAAQAAAASAAASMAQAVIAAAQALAAAGSVQHPLPNYGGTIQALNGSDVEQQQYDGTTFYATRKLKVLDGGPTAPIKSGRTVTISRYEEAVPHINPVNSEENAALYVESVGGPGTGMMAVGGMFVGRSKATAPLLDGIGGVFAGFAEGGAGSGIGLYAEGRCTAGSPNGYFMGAEIRGINESGRDFTYSPDGSSPGMGTWTCGYSADGVKLAGVAHAVGRVNTMWDVAFGVTSNSVKSSTFRDDSTSERSVHIKGLHSWGIDMSDSINTVGMDLGANSIDMGGAVVISGVASPGGLPATQNDWAPIADYQRASVVRTFSGAASTLTGIAQPKFPGTGQPIEGQVLILHNTGGSAITLSSQNSGSAVGNRFALPGASLVLNPAGTITLRYDAINFVWRPISSVN